jgi:hypothetical protein
LYNTGQFKKKVTLSHVYNEVTSEPTITRYTIVRKTLQVCFTFPLQLQTNFWSFPNNFRISRDCRLTGYFIINM